MLDVYLSVRKTLNPYKRKNSFELFGFDFLIDEDFRVWLIEVNTNPYLGVPNEYIKVLLPNMLDDLFRLVLDPVFQPNYEEKHFRENNFEVLYSHPKGINLRRKIDQGIYPVEELTQRRARPKIKRPVRVKKEQPTS